MSQDEAVSAFHDVQAVEEAIQALSEKDLYRLKKAARFRFRSLGSYVAGKDYKDLEQNAIARTLSGDRQWRKGIDLIRHLDQTMRSICDSWRKSQRRAADAGAAEVTAADLIDDDSSESPVDLAPSAEPDQERSIAASQALRDIAGSFADDAQISNIIAGWQQGLKGPEIQEIADMSKKEFDGAVKRLRYKLTRMETKSVH